MFNYETGRQIKCETPYQGEEKSQTSAFPRIDWRKRLIHCVFCQGGYCSNGSPKVTDVLPCSPNEAKSKS